MRSTALTHPPGTLLRYFTSPLWLLESVPLTTHPGILLSPGLSLVALRQRKWLSWCRLFLTPEWLINRKCTYNSGETSLTWRRDGWVLIPPNRRYSIENLPAEDGEEGNPVCQSAERTRSELLQEMGWSGVSESLYRAWKLCRDIFSGWHKLDHLPCGREESEYPIHLPLPALMERCDPPEDLSSSINFSSAQLHIPPNQTKY